MLLRKEGRHRAVAVVGVAEPVRAEPQLAVVEDEEHRRVHELTARTRSELVASAVHVELLPTNEPFRMSEHHAPDGEGTETELVRAHDFTSAADGLSSMELAELRRHDQDVALLHLGETLESLERPRVLAKTIRRELALAVVHELARSAELLHHEIHGTAVAFGRIRDFGEEPLRHRIERRDGELAIGAFQKRERRQHLIDEVRGETEREAEHLCEDVHLLADRLRAAVLIGVAVARSDFFARELVRDGAPRDELAKSRLELAAVLVQALRPTIVELGLVVGIPAETDELQTLRIVGRDQCLCGHRHHPPCCCETIRDARMNGCALVQGERFRNHFWQPKRSPHTP